MSKSKGNVVNPDDVVREYGADAFRVYQAFMGPFDQAVPWDTNGIEGVRKFLDRVWNLFENNAPNPFSDLETIYHQTVKKIGDGIEFMHFNTCISQLMILSNAFADVGGIPTEMRRGFVQLLAPFAPHLADHLWEAAGNEGSVHTALWPKADTELLNEDTATVIVQVNGKKRGEVILPSGAGEEEAKTAAYELPAVAVLLAEGEVKKVIYVQNRIINIVIG
jgi:leucyl-tRNA synthetase